MNSLTLENCWAKTDEWGVPALCVLDHCIDVGSVGREVVSRLGNDHRSLLPSGSAFLIAAHDIGKISPGFQLKCQQWRSLWQKTLNLSAPQMYETYHAKVSQIVLADQLMPQPPLSLLAVGGHHGVYPFAKAKPLFSGNDVGDGVFLDLRNELIKHLEVEFGPLPDQEKLEKNARLHWFTGLMIFSDWIGSNITWFPLDRKSVGPEQSQDTANQALDEIGWARYTVQSQVSFSDLFGFPEANPLQQALYQAADGPGLYVLEAPMGDGKTEAALLAAHRRWTEGEERGLYFALPTQLTSDRIHRRIEAFLNRTVKDWSSIALVHGNAWLTDNRIRPLAPSAPDADPDDPALAGNRWFSDSRRALLAPFGVGTIDQALMSVLPVKFSSLRLFALSGKVVVIDEVHSYDSYTSALVDRAVKWLLELHCTVIILSATLTTKRRQSLVAAAGATSNHLSKAYPLITKVITGSEQAEAVEIPDANPQKKTVYVKCSSVSSHDWLEQAVEAAEAGACVLVIRNTVALAQETFRILEGSCRDTGVEFGCIHSRFTQHDRSTNEACWMEKLGKDPSRRPAHGAIVVGTQVLEQSVDIDADLLITDIAPTDLILQRIGRLHRHERNRPDGFQQPHCLILLPGVDWNADVRKIKEQLKPHCYVYPPFSLYMSEIVFQERPQICIPSEMRDTLEASAKLVEHLPDGASNLLEELQNTDRQMRGTAWMNNVFTQSPVNDTEGAQTRWKPQPSAHLILLESKPRTSNGKVKVQFIDGKECTTIPGHFNFSLARQLHQHAIRIPSYLIRDASLSAPDWLRQHFPGAVLATIDEFGAIKTCHGSDTPAFDFNYNNRTGLTHIRNHNVSLHYEPEEESWL